MLPATGVPIAIDNPTGNEQLDQWSTNVHDCVQKLVSTLNSRSSLLADCVQLNAAMSDATAAISIAPTSSVGYLCAGRLFFDYGYHASAIGIYNNGLQHVPASDDGYKRLLSAKVASEEKFNTRIDFLSLLPLEIVLSNVIPRIFGDQKVIHIGREKYGYLDACRTWRQRIAMAKGLAFHIGPSPGYGHLSLPASDYGYLLDMAPYIEVFIVWDLQDGMVEQLTRRITFTALKILHIDGFRTHPFNQFLPVLHALGASLTQLTVAYKRRYTCETPYRLCDYLDGCPNLVALSISLGQLDSTLVSCQYPKLQKLDLMNCNLKMDDMHAILGSLPELRLLSIIPTPGSSILQTIHQLCPLLQQLVFSKTVPQCLPDISNIQGHQGLRAVSVKDPGDSQKFNGGDLIGYIVKHCDTLESIDIAPWITFSIPRTFLDREATLGVTFKRLRQISYLSYAKECYIPLIVWLVQRAPELEPVQTVHGTLEATVFQELMSPSHCHFKRIGLKANRSSQESEKQFIRHHLNLGQQSNLTEICVEIEKHSLSNSWIMLIPELQQLKHLEVCCEGSRVMRREVLHFTSKIASGCPGLERFTLTAPALPIEYTILSTLSSHTNLKIIVFYATYLSGDASILASCLGQLQRLQSFHLNLYILDAEIYKMFKDSAFQFIYTQRSWYSYR